MMIIDEKLNDISFLIEGKAFKSALKELKNTIKLVKKLRRRK